MKKSLAIYISNYNAIGGVERSIENFCKRMHLHYDLTFLFDWVEDQKMLIEISENANVIKIDRNKIYDFDYAIISSAWGYCAYKNIQAKKFIQIIHADYRQVMSMWNFKYVKNEKTTHHVCVGQTVKEGFEEATPYKCDAIIYNLLDKNIKLGKKPKNKKLNLITVSRLSHEKGFKRMILLAKELELRKIPYTWNVYGNLKTSSANSILKSFQGVENVVFKGITTEPIKEINKADYLVQLSDSEGFAYSVYEAMQTNTPCIITPFLSGQEQIKNGVNGYIIDFEMKNIPFEEILKKDLSVKKFEELGKEEDWIKLLENE
jgi:glycosyltransferase involved in cell wall biosynthesis